MAENDPFATLEPQQTLSNIVIQEVVNPLPGNALLSFNLTEFEKGLLLGLLIYYLFTEGL